MVPGEPEPVVDQLGVLPGDARFRAELRLAERHLLQRLVRPQQRHRGRRFIHLARLDTDEAVLQVVDAADAVLARELVQALYKRDALDLLAVERDGEAPFESKLDITWLVRRLRYRLCPGERLLGWLLPGVFQRPRFDAASPQVLVD